MLDTMLFPPSPALSDCDSLDGIDDLDAFLASQGKLSHFPTPPPQKKDTIIINTEEIPDSSSEYSFDDNMDDRDPMIYVWYTHLTREFREQADLSGITKKADGSKLFMPLMTTRIPLEILQLGYSILTRLRHRHENQLLPINAYLTDWDLWVIAAWMLAADYLCDNPHNLAWWRRNFYDDKIELLTLSEAKIELLKCIDWALHDCASEQAMGPARAKVPTIPGSSNWAEMNTPRRVNPQSQEQGSTHRRMDSAVDDVTAQLEETKIESESKELSSQLDWTIINRPPPPP